METSGKGFSDMDAKHDNPEHWNADQRNHRLHITIRARIVM